MTAVDFAHVNWYAQRAAIAYQSPADIKQAFPHTVQIGSTSATSVQYFLEQDPVHQRQIITIRGTDNLSNVREDADYIPSRNTRLDIYVHSGFDKDTCLIFNALLPMLDKSKPVITTGHSLGAAISTLLMMYLHEAGFSVGPSINFGQPKLTNRNGVQKYQGLPLMRVVDENDVVPLVPPEDFLDSIHGPYEHLGAEILLLQDKYYACEPARQAELASIDSFWKNLGNESVSAHYMKNYLHNIAAKLDGAEEIPYNQRSHYIQD